LEEVVASDEGTRGGSFTFNSGLSGDKEDHTSKTAMELDWKTAPLALRKLGSKSSSAPVCTVRKNPGIAAVRPNSLATVLPSQHQNPLWSPRQENLLNFVLRPQHSWSCPF
jgi:hypothetical protein